MLKIIMVLIYSNYQGGAAINASISFTDMATCEAAAKKISQERKYGDFSAHCVQGGMNDAR